jgi:pSer/pThr/pTyr-binding forkhead associated (FHA) protein
MEAHTIRHRPAAIDPCLRGGRYRETKVAMTIKFLVIQGNPQGKCLQFRAGKEYMFGRGTECHIRPNSEWVSRQHCMLRVTAEGTLIRDLGSRNGTLINGVRLVGEQRLQQGDQVQVGPIVFEVDLNETGERQQRRKDGSDDGASSRVPKNPKPTVPGETGVLLVGDTAEVPFVDQHTTSDIHVTLPDRSGTNLGTPPPT